MAYTIYQAELPDHHTYAELVSDSGRQGQDLYHALAAAALGGWPALPQAEEANNLVPVRIMRVTAWQGQLAYEHIYTYEIHPSEIAGASGDYAVQVARLLDDLPNEFQAAVQRYVEDHTEENDAKLVRIQRLCDKLRHALMEDLAPPKSPGLLSRVRLQITGWWQYLWRASEPYGKHPTRRWKYPRHADRTRT